ncbi:MAG: hypothetical protein ACLTDC_01320 [Lachnospiraceae bacterium]
MWAQESRLAELAATWMLSPRHLLSRMVLIAVTESLPSLFFCRWLMNHPRIAGYR